QDREILRRQVTRTLEPRERLRVRDALDRRLGCEGRAFLLDPREPPYPLELLRQPGLEREQMQHVRLRVAARGLGQRAARPVVALARGRELDAEVRREQDVQPEGFGAEETRGDGRVEEPGEREAPTLELDQVVVAGVQDSDDRRRREHRGERSEVPERDRVDEPGIAGVYGQLDEREALGIVMQAVAL